MCAAEHWAPPAHCAARSPKNSKSQDIIELKIIHDEKFEWGSGWNLMCHLLDDNHLIGLKQPGVGTKKKWAWMSNDPAGSVRLPIDITQLLMF